MMCAARAAVPADFRLPQLELALDVARMAEFLPPGSRWRVAYLRYKPGTSCVVLYEATGRQWAYAKLYSEDAADRLAGRSRVCSYHGGRRLAVVPFPGDLSIRGLRALNEPDVSLAMLERAVPSDRQPFFRRCWGEWEAVRFKPERRCVLRGHYANQEHGARRYYLRLYAGRQGAHASAGYKHFARRGCPIPIPRRIGYTYTHRALLLEEMAGTPLQGFFTSPTPVLGEALDATARALALWHTLTPPAAAPRIPAPELGRAAAVVRALLPAHGSSAAELAAALRTAARPPGERCALLHGDFYFDQVLIAPGAQAGLLDLDRWGTGDPHYDLAAFCAHIAARAVAGGLDAAREAWICARFLESYQSAAGRAISPRSYAGHLSAALLALADSPFRNFHPDWPDQMEALVGRAWTAWRGSC